VTPPETDILLRGVYAFVALWLIARLILYRGRVVLDPVEPYPVGWDMTDVLLVTVLYLILTQTCNLALGTLVAQGKLTKLMGMKLAIACQASVNMATVFYIFQVVFNTRQHSAEALGLSRRHFLLNCGRGVSGYVMYVPIIMMSAALMVHIFTSPWMKELLANELVRKVTQAAGIKAEPQAPVVMLSESRSLPFIVMLSFFAAVVAPIAEEVFFRGFLQQAIRRHCGESATIVLTALAFAGVHMNLRYFLPLFVLGILLSYLYSRTGTLVAPIVVHAIHNGTMVALILRKSAAG